MGKRLFDIAGATLLLLLGAPVMLACAVAVKLESPGPVFYRGIRTGLGGRPFRIFKFRTMTADAEGRGGPSTALNDSRLTRIGPILRMYKLDELPQLCNVLLGDMSLVGPRPQVPLYTDRYDDELRAILTVRPGITDYASIEWIDLDRVLGTEDVDAKYARDIEPRKNELRLRYVREQSFRTDCRILWLTARRLLSIRRQWNTGS
jgi:lipopolysaccharide/colanic/teichoic acid biosynthesis glycosyltransferase